ncbi:hypothetical protein AJ80_01623 [Polytolypa hystricis UAMH7299]|uniref:SMP-LTD domain-containing protein n=1 Tax=Polytolypa hystricis (strain UAMH7299) TaxID=1447883 RepID=A0A2B7Z1G8_POLH7|nr:hypothetical protein AJ80_01623 [Polytolypa hystricis UAMH7299]
MGSLGSFLFVYVLGGVTFIPLILGLFLLHAHLTLPLVSQDSEQTKEDASDIRRPNDDQYSLKTGTDELAEKFQRAHEADVAAGYFAVCREYVPGGVNGKPPERTTPAGEVVAAESPSVYQSMYRSIFDRKQAPTIDPAKSNGKNTKKARNVFFVVLRHGHLMLYDDSEQIEVRYVISLAHHDVSIYGGGGLIPESELWIKRNAICLARKADTIPDPRDSKSSTLPFYLFSENLSEKEDFYFAILKNLEKVPDSPSSPPTSEHYDVKHIITLVQSLHSSEEHLQTRWINALLGRLFLALYRTPEMEETIRRKVSKKIARVKKPNFITRLVLQKIDPGEGAPFITNPRLKDLTVDGDCCAEADISYRGNFRLEVAATARIELGTRFKPREVDMVLAVVLKKLHGHALIRFKPPPSNRIWFSFETMPNMEMSIEPIVSSRQITYGVILRAIESRIREVVAESLVLPFWDDFPFLSTESQVFRGGIWRQAPKPTPTTFIPDETEEQEEGVTEPPTGGEGVEDLNVKDDPVMSVPILPDSPPPALTSRRSAKSVPSHMGDGASGTSSSVEKSALTDPPRALRAQTFSHVAGPVVTPDTVKVDHALWDPKDHDKDAASAMMEISSRSQRNSPVGTPVGSPPGVTPSSFHNRVIHGGSFSSQESKDSTLDSRSRATVYGDSITASAPSISRTSRANSTRSLSSETGKQIHENKSITMPIPKPSKNSDNSQVMGSINSAASVAKKWGMNVFGRNNDFPSKGNDKTYMPDHPIGRGRPLPPPGTPLPPPERFPFISNSISMPKRKPLPPPLLPERRPKDDTPWPSPKPPLPSRSISMAGNTMHSQEELLVITVPQSSEPSTPTSGVGPKPTDETQVAAEGRDTSSSESLPMATRVDVVPEASAERMSHSSGEILSV